MNSPAPTRTASGPAHHLVRFAAARAPAGLTQRLEEEWLADLGERKGALQRLRFALGCCRATHAILGQAAADNVVVSTGSVGELAGGGTSPLHLPASHPGLLVLIVLFHALLVFGLATGLARRTVEVVAPHITATFYQPTNSLPPAPPAPELPPAPPAPATIGQAPKAAGRSTPVILCACASD